MRDDGPTDTAVLKLPVSPSIVMLPVLLEIFTPVISTPVPELVVVPVTCTVPPAVLIALSANVSWLSRKSALKITPVPLKHEPELVVPVIVIFFPLVASRTLPRICTASPECPSTLMSPEPVIRVP